MAYAMLAELPPIYGLYACIVPVFVYGILGTSRHVHIGPFALVSMMVASTLSYINPTTDLPNYIKAMTTLWGVSCKESVFLNIVIKLFFTDLRNQFNWWAFLIGTSATVILYAMKKLNKKYLPKKPLPVEVVLLPNRNA